MSVLLEERAQCSWYFDIMHQLLISWMKLLIDVLFSDACWVFLAMYLGGAVVGKFTTVNIFCIFYIKYWFNNSFEKCHQLFRNFCLLISGATIAKSNQGYSSYRQPVLHGRSLQLTTTAASHHWRNKRGWLHKNNFKIQCF